MELGEFEKAAAHYDRIEGDSFYQADKLYEQVWAIIKQKNEIREQRLEDGDELSEDDRIRLDMRERDLVQQALRGVEIFRLAYPEHEYTAQLKLLSGWPGVRPTVRPAEKASRCVSIY